MTGTFQPCQIGQYRSMTASTPGFCRPIELSIPPGVSVTRAVGCPPVAAGWCPCSRSRRYAERPRPRRTPRRNRTFRMRQGWGSPAGGPPRRQLHRQVDPIESLALGQRGRTAIGAPRSATAEPPVSTRARPSAGLRVRSTGTMALLMVRTVGVRFGFAMPLAGLAAPFPKRTSAAVTTLFFGFIASASGARRPCDLIGGEHGTLAAYSQRALDANDHAAQAGAHGAAHRLLHGDLQKRLAPGGRDPSGSTLPAPLLRPSLATPSRSRRPAASCASRASIGCGPQAKA